MGGEVAARASTCGELEDSGFGGLVETVCAQAHDALWRSVGDHFRERMREELIVALLDRVTLLSREGTTLRLGVLDSFTLERLERRYVQLMGDVATALAGEPVAIELALSKAEEGPARGGTGAPLVGASCAGPVQPDPGSRLGHAPAGSGGESPGRVQDVVSGSPPGVAMGMDREPREASAPDAPADEGVARGAEGPGPRPKLLDFAVGLSNEEAYSAAMRVLAEPGRTFNPLYIHGPSGTGKTHLLRALFQTFRERASLRGGGELRAGAGGQAGWRPGEWSQSAQGSREAPGDGRSRRVGYLTAERFFQQYAASAQARTLPRFQERFRGLEVLLVDDLQRLVNKGKTQVELLHTLSTLVDSGRQVIVSADVPPRGLQGIDASLVGRFSGGLVVGLRRADAATRLAVASLTSRRLRTAFAPGVLELVAERVRGGAREVQGVINQLHLRQQTCARTLALEEARSILDALLLDLRRGVTLARILEAACAYYETTPEALLAEGRDRGAGRARRVAMYLADKYTDESKASIGRCFGGRRHTSVRHAVTTVERALAARDHLLAREIEGVEARLEE